MKITAVIVGYKKYAEYTLPLVRSILKTNPDIDIVVVDNCSPEPYPVIEGATVIRNSKSSLPSGFNYGTRYQRSDWYVLLCNDVIFHKPVTKRIEALDSSAVYGFYVNPVGGPRGNGLPWVWMPNWCYFLPDKIWQAVGDWDEHFDPMWGEDMDYSKRVLDAGFKQVCFDRRDWGIEHLMTKTKKQERIEFLKNKQHTDKMLEYIKGKHGC
jgi:GT2 family glycosyltransferase